MKVNISVYQLRKMYLEKHPNGHYFDSDTLKFFGESISTMSVLKNTCEVTDCMEKNILVMYYLNYQKIIQQEKREHTDFLMLIH